MHREVLKASSLCSQRAKALWPGLWGAWSTTRPCRPWEWQHGLVLSHRTCSALRAPMHGSTQSLCTGLKVNKCFTAYSSALENKLEPVQMPSLWVTSFPSPFYTLSPKVVALRHLLWKDIIILSSSPLSLFPASAPHCTVISSYRSFLNLVWKLSRAMRYHYQFCKVQFRAVAE